MKRQTSSFYGYVMHQDSITWCLWMLITGSHTDYKVNKTNKQKVLCSLKFLIESCTSSEYFETWIDEFADVELKGYRELSVFMRVQVYVYIEIIAFDMFLYSVWHYQHPYLAISKYQLRGWIAILEDMISNADCQTSSLIVLQLIKLLCSGWIACIFMPTAMKLQELAKNTQLLSNRWYA